MTLSQLECFVAVARNAHFGRAARQIKKTQPALSLQIQRLEADLNLTLFERNGTNVSLTAAGETLLSSAEKVLNEIHEARVRLLEIGTGRKGRVRVGILPTMAAHFLPSILERFYAQGSGVEVDIQEERFVSELRSLLLENQLDICVSLAFTGSGASTVRLKSIPLLTERYALGLSVRHKLAGKPRVALASLKKEHFVVYKTPGHSIRETTLGLCRAAGFEPDVICMSEHAETIQSLVAANLGVTILPEMVLRGARERGVAMVSIEEQHSSRTIYATWRVGHYLSPAARRFLACARETGEKWRA